MGDAAVEHNALADEILDDLPKLVKDLPAGISTSTLQDYYGRPSVEINRALRVLKERGEIIVEFENSMGWIKPKGSAPADAPRVAPHLTPIAATRAPVLPPADDEDEPPPEPPRPAAMSVPVEALTPAHGAQRPPALERVYAALAAMTAPGTTMQVQYGLLAQRADVPQSSLSVLVHTLATQRRIEIVESRRGMAPKLRVTARPGDPVTPETPKEAPKEASTHPRPTETLMAAVAAVQRDADTKPASTFKAGVRQASKDQTLTRFASADVEPDRVRDLRPDHPMVALERTIYPTTVVSPWESPRLLVSGHNNAKLGGEVLKGPWTGMPIFHLTLEERASCPRSCAQWLACYGNAMHMARRHDHRDPNFLNLLEAELWMMQREHRETGFALRLHTLGDFYSLDYVQFWADALDHFPGLRIYGYTANDPHSKVASEAAIGKAIEWLTQRAWDSFAIRFSRTDPLAQSSVVLMEPSEDENVIMCPQQREATLACGSCGLCWAEPARDKAIGFLKHGPKAAGPRS